ncbi:probable purple acid phosphatase 20 [Triticum aestivum]|nr:probable purple acid phosphatase 20 [Triticum aestivum]
MLAYGIPGDIVDECVRMSESTCLLSLYSFCTAVVEVFSPEYLKEPNAADTERLLGRYKGHVKGATVILEVVASQDLWIWHSFFGMAGSQNDISVLQRSPVFARLAEGHSPELNFELNGHHYNNGYYLADEIYPQWSTLVKTIPNPQGEETKFASVLSTTATGSTALALIVLAAFVLSMLSTSLAVTSSYVRPRPRATLSLPKDAGGQTPTQVHISTVGHDEMRVTWITEDDAPAVVEYGTTSGQYPFSATGTTTSYSYLALYHSGNIHDAVVGPLKPSTTYYYRCSSDPSREFSFRTPPASLPFTFVIVGDLGQTGWTKSTLQHIAATDYDMLLLPGDLSYADFLQPRWDSYGRLVEPLASARPWMVTEGNHEIERIPLLEPRAFKAYNARWRMPYDAGDSPSGSNLYYSFDVAGGMVHVIMLGSYTGFEAGTAQHEWLRGDLARIDRGKTPFVVALVHAPWYNSNEAHQGEGDDMRDAMEALLRAARVDAVFAGHVHAYERFTRVYGGMEDQCGPVYVTIGDGGNREGLADEYIDPQPKTSVFREASFGHGRLQVVNATHDDDQPVVADQVWIASLASNPDCNNPAGTGAQA